MDGHTTKRSASPFRTGRSIARFPTRDSARAIPAARRTTTSAACDTSRASRARATSIAAGITSRPTSPTITTGSSASRPRSRHNTAKSAATASTTTTTATQTKTIPHASHAATAKSTTARNATEATSATPLALRSWVPATPEPSHATIRAAIT